VTSVPVNGSVDGISFDPVTDQLRIIVRPSSGGNPPTQNFLANPVSGATVIEGPLVYTAGDPNAGATPIAAPIAYTNQDQLYGIDLARRLLFRVDQPSTGMASTVGPLGIQLTSSFGGFDIVGASDAFMTTLGIDFYSVDLSTGAATLIGTTVNQIRDIAQVQIGPVQSVPEPTSMSLLGLSLAGMFALRRRRAIQTTSPE
jgi:hypothetical protein